MNVIMNDKTKLILSTALITATVVYTVDRFLSSKTKPKSFPKPTNVTITYWKGRGRAEAIRLMLAAAEIEFTHAVPGYDDIQHLEQPHHLQSLRDDGYLTAGQVPLLRMDNQSYVQSMATVRMLARRFDLNGSTPLEQSTIDIAAEVILDFRNATGGSWEYGMGGMEPSEEQRAKIRRGTSKYVPILEKMLNNKQWLATNEKWSYADVMAFEVLSQINEGGSGSDLNGYPNLLKYVTRLNEKFKKYVESEFRFNKTNQKEVLEYKKSVNRTLGR